MKVSTPNELLRAVKLELEADTEPTPEEWREMVELLYDALKANLNNAPCAKPVTSLSNFRDEIDDFNDSIYGKNILGYPYPHPLATYPKQIISSVWP